MHYCPYCSTAISNSVKVCPHCRKTIDESAIQERYNPDSSSEVNKGVDKKLWIKERAHIIYPILGIILGLIIGALFSYGFAQTQFSAERSGYEDQISGLEMQIENQKKAVEQSKAGIDAVINQKDEIIKILKEQNKLISQIITFTRRLARNSVITPNTTGQADYYSRNFRYLDRQYDVQIEKLKSLGITNITKPDLRTVPQFLSE